MLKNADGTITLTQEEFEEINEAFQGLYYALNAGPSFIGDYFSSHEDYVNMQKWHHQLNGEKFNEEDYE